MTPVASEPATIAHTLRVLHVGVANRGTWPLEKCNPSTGFKIAALCDVSNDALRAARERAGLGERDCFTDLDVALRESEVDCVILCVPTVLHVPFVKKCITAGRAVLVEKGMAPDWVRAREMVRAVSEANAKVCIAQNYRYNSTERTIARVLSDSGFPAYLGDVHLLSYTQNRVRPLPRTLTYPFASVWDMSCHHFDNLISWLGPVREMTAHSWGAAWSAYEHDNNTSAHMLFENDTHVHYLHTHDAARNTFEVQAHGRNGALVCTGSITFNARPLEQFGTREEIRIAPEPAAGESDMLRDFHAYITRDIEPGISARNNLETMAMCEMMVRSITQKRTVARSELNDA